MRGYIFFSILLFLSLAGVQDISAQSYPQPPSRSTGEIADRNPRVIKINFLSPFVLTANVAYEQFITSKLSFQLGAYYNGISIEEDILWFDVPSARYRSFALTPEVRFYTGRLTRTNLNGFYLAPFVRFQHTDIKITTDQQEDNQQVENKTYEGSLSMIRLGAIAGYKFIFNDRINLEIFAGPSVRAAKWFNANFNTYNAEDFLPNGIGLRGGMTLGYGF